MAILLNLVKSFDRFNADIRALFLDNRLADSCKPRGVNMFRVLSTFAVI